MNFFDLHCDTLSVCYDNKTDLNDSNLAVSLLGNGIFDKRISVTALFIPDGKKMPEKYFNEMYNYSVEMLKKSKISILKSGCCPENGVILSVENGGMLASVDNIVDKMFTLGIRSVGLTWNGQNAWASGCAEKGGLTTTGRNIIRQLNKYSMAVDLSHINEEGFYEAIELTDHPICSHTACRHNLEHNRNLNDRQISKIIKCNGLIGLCFYPSFLGQGNVFDRFLAHLYHIYELGGQNNVAIGSDFDGCHTVAPLKTDKDIPALFEYLLSKHIPQQVLKKTFFDNSNIFFTYLLTKQ